MFRQCVWEDRSTDLLERLRPDERFDSLAALVAQMAVDKARAREALAREAAKHKANG